MDGRVLGEHPRSFGRDRENRAVQHPRNAGGERMPLLVTGLNSTTFGLVQFGEPSRSSARSDQMFVVGPGALGVHHYDPRAGVDRYHASANRRGNC